MNLKNLQAKIDAKNKRKIKNRKNWHPIIIIPKIKGNADVNSFLSIPMTKLKALRTGAKNTKKR